MEKVENRYRFQVKLGGTVTLTWRQIEDSEPLLQSIGWSRVPLRRPDDFASRPAAVRALVAQILDYLEAGKKIGEIPWDCLDLSSLSDFQKQVYRTISEIPH